MLLGMTEVEQRHRGSFKQMETELIDKLDMLVNETSEDEECDEVGSIREGLMGVGDIQPLLC